MMIRKMIFEDIPSLAELYRQFWNVPSDVAKMEELFHRVQKQEEYVLLCAIEENNIEGNNLIGTVMGIVCEELYGDCRPFLLIENLIVDQHHRRKGVGGLLLAELEKWARDKNCRQAILVSEASREDARSFYLARGFPPDSIGFKKKL
jgi:GNAT superfamily N-acetyltransferase